jgi:transcriptional regulator with XRE-family HTH domain
MTNTNNIKKDLSTKDFCKQTCIYTGNFIKLLRKERMINLKSISGILGISIPQYIKYERGINRISLGKLLILFEFFQYDINDFIKNVTLYSDSPTQRDARDALPGFKNFNKLTARQYKIVDKLINDITTLSMVA